MEDDFNMFYCTICHVCKNCIDSSEPMRFCSGCKLVHYCCRSHQKDDWPTHKEFCHCIQQIAKTTGTKHVFEEASNFPREDLKSWNKLRMSVIHLVELIMKRSLSTVESQMLLFPPVCNFCRGFKSQEMIYCSSCKTVVYCCIVHQKSDTNHRTICETLSRSFNIDSYRFINRRLPCDFSSSTMNLNELPDNMKESLNCLVKGIGSLGTEELILSEPLSYTLSLVFVLCRISVFTKNCLTVHIVGADSMELWAMHSLPLVFNFLPQLRRLKVVIIGPNLSYNFTVPSEIEEKCFVDLVKNTFYHEYLSSSNCTQPDVIAVFNCGFCEFVKEPEKDIWKKSLPSIFNFTECTVIITSYNSKEAAADLKRLCEMKQSNITYSILYENRLNPFCSLYPHRDWELDQDVFFVNKYISVLKT